MNLVANAKFNIIKELDAVLLYQGKLIKEQDRKIKEQKEYLVKLEKEKYRMKFGR